MRSSILAMTVLLSAECGLQAQSDLGLKVIREVVIESGSDTLTYSPDGRWLASGGARGDLKLVDTRAGKVARVIQVPGSANGELRFSSDSKRLAIVARRCGLGGAGREPGSLRGFYGEIAPSARGVWGCIGLEP